MGLDETRATTVEAAAGTAGLTPAEVRQAYGFEGISFATTSGAPVVGDGSGQTIAIVTAYDDPTIVDDLKAFDAAYGLPDLSTDGSAGTGSFVKVGIDASGRASTRDYPEVAPAGARINAQETVLDVEWAHAIAPGANIVLVEAEDAQPDPLLQAVDYAREVPGVSVVSMSWGSGEGGVPAATLQALDSHFTTPSGHAGVTFVASSGDTSTPSWPAVSPNVVGVGGTTLSPSDGNDRGETAWQDSGGGVSSDFPIPSYQQAALSAGPTPIADEGRRVAPDVAYDADPATGFSVYDSTASNGWTVLGGTSAGAPQWAGLFAIADQGRALAGLSSLDGPSQTLPALYQAPASDFHDVTRGGNVQEQAGPGFDTLTGLGSPVANLLIPTLVAFPIAASTAPGITAVTPASLTAATTATAAATSFGSILSATDPATPGTNELAFPGGIEFIDGSPNGAFMTSGEVDDITNAGTPSEMKYELFAPSPDQTFDPYTLSNGSGLTGNDPNTFTVAGVQFKLTGLQIEASDIKLQGTVTIPQLSNLTFTVTGTNYLIIGASGISLTGRP